jgi:thiol:disulfide interchange protein DsbC
MSMNRSRILSTALGIALAIAAGTPAVAQPAAYSEVTGDAAKRIRASVEQLIPGMKVDSIRTTPIAGLYEVALGPRLVYMTESGRYLVQGSIIDVDKKENITEARAGAARMRAIDALGEDQMLVFGPKSAPHTVTVFTDIDCGYCRKLHGEMAKYNDAGIRVRYLFFPRSGEGGESYKKAVSVWCASDRKQAMTDAKAGKDVPAKSCPNPVDEHMAMGELVGVSGTPFMVLPDGGDLPGYVPAERLKRILAEHAPPSKN